MTARLFQLVQIIGLATGDRPGMRVTDRMGIQTSRLTIIRRIIALRAGPVRPVIQLGIDDFSFKMLKNLREALEECLARLLATKWKTQTQQTLEEYLPIGEAPRSTRRSPKVEHLQQAYREQRLACYEQVVTLRKLGMSQAAIAERVGISPSTVNNWLAAGIYPEIRRGPYVSRLDPYLPYLFQRWESGCHNMVRLHQELVARGFKGSFPTH